MKWPFTITICIFAFVSFSSSAPIFIQDDMALMYPMEYYPGYLQTDFVNLDVAKWFRKAADSVKHFYNYVNNLIFGNGVAKPIFERYPTLKEDKKPENDSNALNTHPTEQNANLPRVQAFEVHKDSNGNYIVKSLTNENAHIQISEDNAIKPGVKLDKPVNFMLNDDPMFRRINDKVAKYPFQWNEKFEKDEILFPGAFQNNEMNPELLWHSGIFPFQPMNAFNVLGEQVPIQYQPNQLPSELETSQNNKIGDQNIEQSEPSTYSPSTTDQVEVTNNKITEEIQNDETSDSSNDEKKSNEDSRPYEIVMEVERIKQNHSHSESDSNSQPDKTDNNDETDSDPFQNSVMPDGITDDEWDSTDDDDKNKELTESEYIQPSSDDSNQNNPEPSHESDQNDREAETSKKSIPDVTNGDEDNLTIERSEPSERKTLDVERVTKIFEKPNSDESDIARRVLAIVQPSEN